MTIDTNIEGIKERIEALAKVIKNLLREALVHNKSTKGGAEAIVSPLQPEDYKRMDDEVSEHRRVLD